MPSLVILPTTVIFQRSWIHYVSLGLNDNCSTIKTLIFLMEPLPNTNQVFSLVIQQERKLVGNNSVIENKMVISIVNATEK